MQRRAVYRQFYLPKVAMSPEPAASKPTPRAVRWALVALLVGLGFGLARTTALTLRDVGWAREANAAPLEWLPAGKQVRALDAFLNRVGARIPSGSRVRFSVAPEVAVDEAGIVLLWAQHLRPQYDWLLAAEWPPPFECRYWVTLGTHLDEPGWTPMLEDRDGGSYVRQP